MANQSPQAESVFLTPDNKIEREMLIADRQTAGFPTPVDTVITQLLIVLSLAANDGVRWTFEDARADKLPEALEDE